MELNELNGVCWVLRGMAARPVRKVKKQRHLVEEDVSSSSSSSSKGGRPSFLQQYDKDIVQLSNMHYKPSKIAELLCSQYSLDPNIVSRTGIES